jgi:hypothetical protein
MGDLLDFDGWRTKVVWDRARESPFLVDFRFRSGFFGSSRMAASEASLFAFYNSS